MSIIDSVRQRIANWLLPEEQLDRAYMAELMARQTRYSYYAGEQRRQIKPKEGQADDNLITNFVSLIIERSLSLLLGGGVQFDFGEGTAVQQYIDDVWRANKRDILLHRAGQHAALTGTGYLKIIPGGYEENGRSLPRLIALDSRWMKVETAPDDMEVVAAYTMRYNVTVTGANGQAENIARREITRVNPDNPGIWVVEYWVNSRATSGKWMLESSQVWPYPFPPIVHWQNLPYPGVYGRSDVDDVLEIQDRYNFVASNISKIIRYHAHPKTWGRNVNLSNKVSWGGDEMVTVTGDTAQIANLEMQSDLASSQNYLMSLRQSLFDISRTVDLSSLEGRIGMLTNFGLRVLYTDSTAKNESKQSLMGEALEEVNYRLLSLAGMDTSNPGIVVWPDNLPRDEFQNLQADVIELDAGLVSKETIATENGRDWEQEKERIAAETAAAAQRLQGMGLGNGQNSDNNDDTDRVRNQTAV